MKIGILGGGQLGMMMARESQSLGHTFNIYSPDSSVLTAPHSTLYQGTFDDSQKLQAFAKENDILTYEFEHLPVQTLKELKTQIRPSLKALEISQDRLLEKNHMDDCGIPLPEFAPVFKEADLSQALTLVGLPCILKTTRQGYDGKGQRVVRSQEDAIKAFQELKPHPLIAEQWISFQRELSIIGVRDLKRNIAFYPIVETLHKSGVLFRVIAPAPQLNPTLEKAAQTYLTKLFETFDYIGVLTLELFEKSGSLLANEIAPRVHNSGHWTIEGAETSQFENHIRAISGMELGSTQTKSTTLMYNVVGEMPHASFFTQHPQLKLHDYKKQARPGRKLAHLTASFKTLAELQAFQQTVEAHIPFKLN